MKSPTWAVVAALMLLPFAPFAAQEPGGIQRAQEPGETRTALLDASVSAEDLEIFADIYVALEKTSIKYEQELANVESEQEARNLQTRMQRESQEKIEKHGWTEEKYERVSEAVNANPALLERVLALIEERS